MNEIQQQDRAYCLGLAFRLNAEANKVRRERNVQRVLWCLVVMVGVSLVGMWL